MKTAGFTLTELLVVITIIAVLSVLLITGGHSLRDASNAAVCTANMKQLGGYIAQYAAEHQNHLLPVLDRNTSADGKSGRTWFQILHFEKILPFSQWHQLPRSVMRCPARTAPNPRPHYANNLPSSDFDGSHYGMISYIGFNNLLFKGDPRLKITNLQDPSQTLLITETNYWYFMHPDHNGHRISPHKGGCNLLYLDGHVVFHAGELPVYTAADRAKRTLPPFY